MKPEQLKNWWQTLPGILTSLAGIITATTGLVVALQQAGFLGTSVTGDNSPSELSTIADEISPKAIANPATPEPLASSISTPSWVEPLTTSESSREVKAVIRDSDGYTNVRAGAGLQFRTIARVLEGETFYTIPQETEWWPVRTSDNTFGYIHRSRIKLQR